MQPQSRKQRGHSTALLACSDTTIVKLLQTSKQKTEAEEESNEHASEDLVSLNFQRKSDRSSWGIGGGAYLSSLRSLTGAD